MCSLNNTKKRIVICQSDLTYEKSPWHTFSNQLFMFLTFAMVRLLILEMGADVEILIKKPWPVL